MTDTPTTFEPLSFDPALIYHAASVPGHGEYRAADWLEREGYKTFIPSRSAIVRQVGGKRLVRRPVFPSYVFVGRAENQSALSILRVPGVRSIVVADGRPAALPPWLMRTLALADEMGAFSAPARPTYVAGQRVRITADAWSGLIGEVMRAPESRRISVLLSYYGKRHTLTVDLDKVEAA